jgi:hypothetical protein
MLQLLLAVGVFEIEVVNGPVDGVAFALGGFGRFLVLLLASLEGGLLLQESRFLRGLRGRSVQSCELELDLPKPCGASRCGTSFGFRLFPEGLSPRQGVGFEGGEIKPPGLRVFLSPRPPFEACPEFLNLKGRGLAVFLAPPVAGEARRTRCPG